MEDLTISELQHLLALQGLWYQNGCEECDLIRAKLETIIQEKKQEQDRKLGICGREIVKSGSNAG